MVRSVGALERVKPWGKYLVNKYDQQFIKHLIGTFKLIFKPLLWKYYLLLTGPILIIFSIGNGFVFVIFLIACCLWGRNAKLGSLLGWFVVSVTIFIFTISPEPDHFIESLLRAAPRGSSIRISPEMLRNIIPDTIPWKIIWSLLFGVPLGMVLGTFIGLLGKAVFGCHPRIN